MKVILLILGAVVALLVANGGLGDKALGPLPDNAQDCIAQGHYWASNDVAEGYCVGAPPHHFP